MRKSAWLLLGSLLVSSLAFAAGKPPRLGSFKGNLDVATATHEGQLPQLVRPETVKLRVNGNRLYVTQKGGTWVQSFKITSDAVGHDGVRSIQYVRDSKYGVGKRNEQRLDAADPPGTTVGYRGLSGHGSVAVSADGRMGWRNVGQARIIGTRGEGETVNFPVGWDELFQGYR